MSTQPHHQDFMRLALKLAARGRGKVEPNPLVGAALVKKGRVMAAGYHRRFGGPHAEINVLTQARGTAKGGTMYVTLEPCCHFGKTPPCTTALIQAGIKCVVVACQDPFPQVKGRGIRQLRRAGIEVRTGVLEAEAKTVNAPYFTLQTKRRPFFIAKWAMTLDGRIATRSGDSRWVSGESSRRQVHHLRSLADAVMVGIGTALGDDPLLTARVRGARQPVRIVVDSRARLPLSSRLVQSASQSPVTLATTRKAPRRKIDALKRAGCQVLVLPSKQGKVDLHQLAKLLGDRQITNVLVEGGAKLFGTMFDAALIDKVVVFVAPKLVGGKQAPCAIAGTGLERMGQARQLYQMHTRRLGEDTVITGFLHNPAKL